MRLSKAPLGSPEFERLLKRLAADINEAVVFNRLRAALNAAFDEYSRELNESNTFWTLSLQAYAEVVVYRLSRVYVNHNDALTLHAWLADIEAHPQLLARATDPAQLSRDIESVGDKEPLVKKLICLRGNFIAHTNWGHTASGGTKIKKENFSLTWDEIDQLNSRAAEILNRYSELFNKTLFSMDIACRDDYKRILDAVRGQLNRWDAEIESDTERART